ncbi:MAG: DUF2125 domain-containing protein [Rhodobacteraceae bacterium]|nr:DUF2125 domain-containing protein [Paracoccaceae bacterium]
MPLIVITILLAVFGYTAYWHYAARVLNAEISAFLTAARHLDVEHHNLGGFPYRFDLDLTAPRLTSASGAVTWQAQQLHLHALAYRPQHVIAVFPREQIITLGGIPWRLSSSDARASIISDAALPAQIDRANLVFETLEFTDGTALHSADSFRAALRQQENAPHQVAIELHGLRPGPAMRAILDPTSLLPPMLTRLALRGRIDLDAAGSDGSTHDPVNGLEITDLVMEWGDITLEGTGRLRRDSLGRFSGDMMLTTAQAQLVLDVVEQAQLLLPDQAQIARMLAASMQDQESGMLTLPLQIRDSAIFVGPVALGALPVF